MDESTNEPRPGDDAFNGFHMSLPENCVEYMLFVINDHPEAQRTTLSSLETTRKVALRRLDELTKDYIWQREPLKLETKIENGLVYLHGRTDYGDNVEDEWLIVYFLRALSLSFPNLWIRIFDSDGEFLLIEAAKVLPKWLSPEMDANRVWINSGQLRIIPLLSSSPASTSKAHQQISLHEALSVIRTTPTLLTHSPFIEAEAFYRLEKYPGQITSSLHHTLVAIPRKLAYILHERPKAVAPATEAFYLRDPVSLKPLLATTSKSLLFPPTDLVTISVRLTKVLYAQLKSQHFDPPPVWRDHFKIQGAQLEELSLSTETEEGRQALQKLQTLTRLEMGMKLTTGFEILARGAEKSDSRVAREVALLLEDLAEDGEENALPTDEEIKGWQDVDKEDDDGWMDIDFADFERELAGGGGGGGGGWMGGLPEEQQQKKKDGVDGTAGKMPTFRDATIQADLRKIVSRFEAFLNDETAGLDGAEIDEMDQDDDNDEEEEEEDSDIDTDDDEDEDKEVSFDEEQFSRMMREMMGIPTIGSETTASQQKPDTKGKGKEKTAAESEDEESMGKDEQELEALMAQMEKELNSYGALQLDSQKAKVKTSSSTRTLKGEVQGESSKGETQEVVKTTAADDESGDGEEGGDEEEEGEEGEDVDLDYNLAKNLLESFKSQAGMAGPAGNLLGLMGMMLPRDEEDSDGEGKPR
ncbi:SGT1 protein-domain-containing protein [Copromyces sp. CBS 386.78]|nr:SGT1 protein-domain-containing protein [Copromyces sp. CBS 386.78]